MKLHAIVSDFETAKVAVAGGATVVQLRLKDASTDEVVAVGAPFRELGATFDIREFQATTLMPTAGIAPMPG